MKWWSRPIDSADAGELSWFFNSHCCCGGNLRQQIRKMTRLVAGGTNSIRLNLIKLFPCNRTYRRIIRVTLQVVIEPSKEWNGKYIFKFFSLASARCDRERRDFDTIFNSHSLYFIPPRWEWVWIPTTLTNLVTGLPSRLINSSTVLQCRCHRRHRCLTVYYFFSISASSSSFIFHPFSLCSPRRRCCCCCHFSIRLNNPTWMKKKTWYFPNLTRLAV